MEIFHLKHAKIVFSVPPKILSIRNKGFSYSLESQKNGIHMIFKVIEVEGNENWSIGDQFLII